MRILQAEPLPRQLSGGFSLPVPELPPEGCVSMAQAMEEKWDLFYYDHRLFAARSWTGLLSYTASLYCDGTSLHVSDIRTSEPYEESDSGRLHLLRELHFIFRSHGNRVIAPHPLPVELAAADGDDSVPFKELLATHTFSRYGEFGWFGTFADTLPLREVPREELAGWINQREKKKSLFFP